MHGSLSAWWLPLCEIPSYLFTGTLIVRVPGLRTTARLAPLHQIGPNLPADGPNSPLHTDRTEPHDVPETAPQRPHMPWKLLSPDPSSRAWRTSTKLCPPEQMQRLSTAAQSDNVKKGVSRRQCTELQWAGTCRAKTTGSQWLPSQHETATSSHLKKPSQGDCDCTGPPHWTKAHGLAGPLADGKGFNSLCSDLQPPRKVKPARA